jgi:penicillin G amidase
MRKDCCGEIDLFDSPFHCDDLRAATRGDHADWLSPAYKNWDALLTEAVRKGLETGEAPADMARWSYGSWHVVDIEQPLSGDTVTVKQVGRAIGPSRRFTMDWSYVDGSTENIVLGESGKPLSEYFRGKWNSYYGGTTFAFPFIPAAVAAETWHTLRLLP